METLKFQVAYMVYFAPRSNLASMQISPVQDMQVGAKLVLF